jgi:hypothetical protein
MLALRESLSRVETRFAHLHARFAVEEGPAPDACTILSFSELQ